VNSASVTLTRSLALAQHPDLDVERVRGAAGALDFGIAADRIAGMLIIVRLPPLIYNPTGRQSRSASDEDREANGS
jgi:hypothetical protein